VQGVLSGLLRAQPPGGFVQGVLSGLFQHVRRLHPDEAARPAYFPTTAHSAGRGNGVLRPAARFRCIGGPRLPIGGDGTDLVVLFPF
jgi:hypothetical protein